MCRSSVFAWIRCFLYIWTLSKCIVINNKYLTQRQKILRSFLFCNAWFDINRNESCKNTAVARTTLLRLVNEKTKTHNISLRFCLLNLDVSFYERCRQLCKQFPESVPFSGRKNIHSITYATSNTLAYFLVQSDHLRHTWFNSPYSNALQLSWNVEKCICRWMYIYARPATTSRLIHNFLCIPFSLTVTVRLSHFLASQTAVPWT